MIFPTASQFKILRIAIWQFVVSFVVLHVQRHIADLTFETSFVPYLKENKNIWIPIHTFIIYPKYWDTLSTYHTCPKIWNNPFFLTDWRMHVTPPKLCLQGIFKYSFFNWVEQSNRHGLSQVCIYLRKSPWLIEILKAGNKADSFQEIGLMALDSSLSRTLLYTLHTCISR